MKKNLKTNWNASISDTTRMRTGLIQLAQAGNPLENNFAVIKKGSKEHKRMKAKYFSK